MRTISVTKSELWSSNAAPQAWTKDNRITYNVVDGNNIWSAHSADPDGGNVKPWPVTVANTNQGASDVTPDGKYAVLTVERLGHAGALGDTVTQPGKGVYNDLWLSDGENSWPLSGAGTRTISGISIIWPRFDTTGTKIVWSQMYKQGLKLATEPLGYWQIKVADLVWSGGVPSLLNVKTIEPHQQRFYETYGLANGKIIFASDMTRPLGLYDSQIWTMNLDGSGAKQVSFNVPVWFMNSYCEFSANPLKDGSLIYNRVYQSKTSGMDSWVTRPDGSHYRLTFWSDDKMHEGHVAGGFAVSPDETKMITGYASDASAASISAVMFSLSG